MASQAIYSTTKIFVITGSVYGANNYQEIPGVLNIAGPAFVKTSIDITNMSTVGTREYMSSPLADAGELTVGLQWTPTNAIHKKLAAFAVTSSNQVNGYKMLFSDGTAYEFSGSLTELSIKADSPDDVLGADAKIKLVGSVTLPA